MSEIADDSSQDPPEASRLAARALVLWAIACRGAVEENAANPTVKELRQRVAAWDSIWVTTELESWERILRAKPPTLVPCAEPVNPFFEQFEALHFFFANPLTRSRCRSTKRKMVKSNGREYTTSIPWKAKQNHGTSKNKIGRTSFEVCPPRAQLG